MIARVLHHAALSCILWLLLYGKESQVLDCVAVHTPPCCMVLLLAVTLTSVCCKEQVQLAGRIAERAGPLHRLGSHRPSQEQPHLTVPTAAPLSAAVLMQYKRARLGIAVAPTPVGPYVYMRSFQPHGQESRDFTVFQARMLSPCAQHLRAGTPSRAPCWL